MVLSATLRTVLSMTMASSPTTSTPRMIHRLRWIAEVSTGPSRTSESFRAGQSQAYARAPHYRYGTGPYRNLFLESYPFFGCFSPRLEGHVGLAELAGLPVDQQRERARGVLADEFDRRGGGAAPALIDALRERPGPA